MAQKYEYTVCGECNIFRLKSYNKTLKMGTYNGKTELRRCTSKVNRV